MDKSRYRALFVEEARRAIGNAEALAARPDALKSNAMALLRCFHTLKGMSATMAYGSITLLAHALEDVCDGVTAGRLQPDAATATLLAEGTDAIRRQVGRVEEGEEPEPDAEMERRIREHLSTGGTTGFRLLVPLAEDEVTAEEPLSAPRTEDAAGAVAEMLAACNRLREVSSSGAVEAEVTRLEDAARSLYARLVELRQVPFGSALPPLRRHLRSLCRQHAREAVLECQGEDVLVDPDVLVPLQAALVQLLHNAVIHGIEPPTERGMLRKPRAGRIVLRVEQAGGLLLIEFADDGRGLDIAALRTAAGDPDGDPVSLATLPGVSTRARVDHHAGRGLGLPAVMHGIELLGGTVDVYSVPGRGVRLCVEVPVHTDLTDVLLVQVGDATLGLLRRQVAVLAGEDPYAAPLLDLPVTGGAAVHVRGHAPVRVDRVLGSVETLVRPAPFPLARVPAILGTTVGPDGRIVFVVDPVPTLGAAP